MNVSVAFRILLGSGIAFVVVLWLLRRTKKALPIEYHLTVLWIYLRFGLCLSCAALFIGVWLYMLLTLRAPNGSLLAPIDLFVSFLLLAPAVYLLVRVGRYGKVSNFSSIEEDRLAQRERLDRHGHHE